ncbi:MAG: hypothetical protein ACRD0H_13180 [Actinomycetes bacterium]
MSQPPRDDDRVIGTGRSPRRDPLRAAGALASLGSVLGVFVGVLSESGIGVLVGAGSLGAVGGALGGLITVTLVIPQRGQLPPRLGTGPPPAPRALRWLCRLLPGEEGTAWVAEVKSCLAETGGRPKRLHYLGSYLLRVPPLIWHAWAEYLRKRQ